MFKKIISKIRISHQEKKLELISEKTLNFDMKARPFVSSSLDFFQDEESKDIVFKNVVPDTYRLLVSSTIKNIFNQQKLYAKFEISEVLKVKSKQFRLGVYNFSDDKGIFEYFKNFSSGDKEYGVITLKIPRFIKYLHITLDCKDSLKTLGLEEIYFGNTNSSIYREAFPENQQKISDESLNREAELNWKRFELNVNSKVEIAVSSLYKNISQNNKKAVLLFKFYDFLGNEIKDQSVDNLGFSHYYNTHYKYIPDTKGGYINVHTFIVPSNISYIELVQVEFNTSGEERVVFKDINLSIKNNELDGIIDLNNIDLFPDSEVLKFGSQVIGGKSINFFADVEYCNCNTNNKKALLLLRFYDKDNNPVASPPSNLLWIEKYSSYYKYLPATKGNIKFYDCKIPEGVAYLDIGLIGFNLKVGEVVKINALSLMYENNQIEPKGVIEARYVQPNDLEVEASILGWEQNIDANKPIMLGIMDEFTQGCFSADVNLIQPRTDNWYGLSEKYQPNLLFIESAWKGNSGNWQYRVSKYSNKPGLEVSQLCHYFREKSIPTVFWNKEDPVHHDRFMESAAEAEYIFTTDENMIESYKNRTGNSKVYTLPFAAQPLLHRPKSLIGRKNKSCFAGSWYGNRHETRGESIVWLLNAAKKYGLDIYDRNYALGHSPFPLQYQEHVIGSLPYLELCEEYRNYRVFLNVNSVTNSPTMFSRRVFELMACGTPIVSTYSQGISEFFDSNAIWLVNSEEEAYEALRVLMTDDQEWRRRSLAGIREIFQNHTYAHRLNYIFEKTNLAQRINVTPRALINIFIKDESDIDFALSFKNTQKYHNYELLLIYDEKSITLDLKELNAISIKGLPKYLEDNVFDLIGMITDHYTYGDNYLIDLINAYIYEPRANALRLCDVSTRGNVFKYGFYEALDGVLFKDKEDYLQKLKQHISNEKIDKYEVYFIDSDELIKRYVGLG